MADPITLSLVAGGISMAGTGLSTINTYQNSRAQADAEKINAREATLAAQRQGVAGGQAEERQRREARALLGEQAAATGESGLAMAGSAADIARQSALNAELDALNIRYDSEMKRRGFNYEASQAKFRAKQAKKAATLSLISGGLQMAGYSASAFGQAGYMKASLSSTGSTAGKSASLSSTGSTAGKSATVIH